MEKSPEEVEQEVAFARVAFAEELIASDNFVRILATLNRLFMAEVERTVTAHKSGKKSQAKRMKHTTDEIFTIMMCAIYRAQEESGFDNPEDLR